MTAAKHKTLVMGAVEGLSYEDKKGTHCERAGRVRLSTLDNAGEVSMRHFLTHNIDAGSTLRTDGWRGYSDAALVGYTIAFGSSALRNERIGLLLTSTESLATSRLGSTQRITALSRSISRAIWTSLSFAPTGATRRWRHSKPCSGSWPRKRR